MIRRAFPLMILVSLAACGPQENDPGPGGVTVGEARSLDEAAEMLDSRVTSAPVDQAPEDAEKSEAE